MKKIKVYIAASLDGYIARPDGNLNWLTKYPFAPDSNYGYNEFYNSIGSIIMGGRTYRELLAMDVEWPYKGKKSYVVSRHSMNANEDIEFITENIIETIADLRSQADKDIWLMGGGELITMFINAEMVDEMQICHVPVIIGSGIPLFPDNPKESNWKLIGNTVYDSGIIKIDYQLSF